MRPTQFYKIIAIQQLLARILLSPISFLYGMVISIRNFFYDIDLVKSSKFSIPVISVGNLSVGGAGKTPHIEYLIRLLQPYINVATLSRGYKRKTKGFRFVEPRDTALMVGDEPLQYRRKYRGVVVAVAENRAIGIPLIVQKYPGIQTILLDDAFQHRSVEPGLNILLSSYENPFYEDYLIPAGRLREYRSGYKRADIIIVTKCPDEISEMEKEDILSGINKLPHQKVFFSKYAYAPPYSFYDPRRRLRLDKDMDVTLVSAIANTQYLFDYLDEEVQEVHSLDYEDHRIFTDRDIEYINTVFKNRPNPKKIIITTEKDATRLDLHRKKISEWKWPLFVLPVEVAFMEDSKADFDQTIKDYLLNFKT